MKYRKDIDGLRAIAVIPVIIYHLGFLPNGYLGVDVFFVISGFLITSIIYSELRNEKFSIWKFYERRIRRIIPLLLVVTIVAFLLGLLLMLPDDLENLCQAVIASNFSANNILMLFTSSDYWAIKNEYKPLMHTWSLGIEEQFYLIYPFGLMVLWKIRSSFIKPTLLILTVLSIGLFLMSSDVASKFYLIQYRFFELSIGGFAAVYLADVDSLKKNWKYSHYVATLLLIAFFILPIGTNSTKIFSVTLLTTVILAVGKYFHTKDDFISFLFQNKLLVFVGKISFSLYMWHQVVFAFARYAFIDEVDLGSSIILILITVMLSLITYYLIENTFRNRLKFKTSLVLITVGLMFFVSTISAFYIYSIGGIFKDYASINMYTSDNADRGFSLFSRTKNIHIQYNENARQFDKKFTTSNKIKVLVVGSSFGRDAVNILRESDIANNIEISYIDINKIQFDGETANRFKIAHRVFIAANKFIGHDWVEDVEKKLQLEIDESKLFCFGTKDFGYSNGIHYNRINEIPDYANYFAKMKNGVVETEKNLKKEWRGKYLSLIDPVRNAQNEVRVFTSNGKFISQDTVHLTKSGAKYYAGYFNELLKEIIGIAKSKSLD